MTGKTVACLSVRQPLTGCVDKLDWELGCGRSHDGRTEWFTGPYGFQLADARPFPFLIPYKGQQGLFRVPVAHVPELFEERSGNG